MVMRKFFFVNGNKTEYSEGENILDALLKNNFDIPSLCFHPDLKIKSSCRLCMVETEGKQIPACSTKIEEGMKIETDTLGIERSRKTNLEMIFAQHCEECHDCVWNSKCELLRFAKKYRAKIGKFTDRKKEYPSFRFGPSLEFDSSKCIDCRNCIEVCSNQGVNFLELKTNNNPKEVAPSGDSDKDCVYCGQCILHCPAGAFEAVGEFESINQPLTDKEKIVIFQIAPAVRVSIGEEFGMSPGTAVTGQLTASLKKIGAHYVFDVSSGADFTTVEESQEILERKDGSLPVLTSCCPSWVKFIEFNHPELVPNLASTRSPHIILGGIIKTFWAEKNGIDPRKIFVISIMPCTSKKFEIERSELKISGMKPVDRVLTVREAAGMIRSKGINLANIKPVFLDNPFGNPSESGIIYGSSGGVMESALRNIGINKVEFRQIKDGVREADILIGEKNYKVAVVSGLGNAVKIIDEIKNNPKKYHCIEVMACPGGCIGGGGQPLPSNNTIKEKRKNGLREIAKEKVFKRASDNPALKEVYDYFQKSGKRSEILHTTYKKRDKESFDII